MTLTAPEHLRGRMRHATAETRAERAAWAAQAGRDGYTAAEIAAALRVHKHTAVAAMRAGGCSLMDQPHFRDRLSVVRFGGQGVKARVNRDAFCALWASGVSTRRIAAAIGCTGANVGLIAKSFGLPPRPLGAPLCDDARFARMWAFGLPTRVIADQIGYGSTVAVNNRAKRMGLTQRAPEYRKQTLAAFLEAELGRKMGEAA